MTVDVLSTSDARWKAFLARVKHDFYHVPEYLELEASRLGGTALAFVAEEGDRFLLLVAIVREVVLEHRGEIESVRDAASPYGYPSPLLCAEPDEAAFVAAAMPAIVEELCRRKICSLFVRLHPMLPLPPAALPGSGTVVQHGETVWIDLTQPQEELWHQTRLSDRNRINKLRRRGVVARMDDSWAHVDRFVEIYDQTMRHVGAAGWYHFGKDYFRTLRDALGARIHLCVVEAGDEITSAGLFTETCGLVQFHLSGTADEHRREAPSRLMLDFVRTWAKERGNVCFHLGGGLGAGADSLFEFKAGFSKLRAPFGTWRLITMPDVYARAIRAWEARDGRAADPIDGFFPAYRKPSSRP